MLVISFNGLFILSGSSMVSFKFCSWVKEYISFMCVYILVGALDDMGERGDGKCTGVGVWYVSVLLL